MGEIERVHDWLANVGIDLPWQASQPCLDGIDAFADLRPGRGMDLDGQYPHRGNCDSLWPRFVDGHSTVALRKLDLRAALRKKVFWFGLGERAAKRAVVRRTDLQFLSNLSGQVRADMFI